MERGFQQPRRLYRQRTIRCLLPPADRACEDRPAGAWSNKLPEMPPKYYAADGWDSEGRPHRRRPARLAQLAGPRLEADARRSRTALFLEQEDSPDEASSSRRRPGGVIAAETISAKHAPADEIVIVGDEPRRRTRGMAILPVDGPSASPTLLRHDPKHTRSTPKPCARARGNSTPHGAASRSTTAVRSLRHAAHRHRVEPEPPIRGIDLAGVHSWTLSKTRARSREQSARVLQMGAGFIGCIIAGRWPRVAMQLTVVEMATTWCRMMGPDGGRMIKEWCEVKGVTVAPHPRQAIDTGRPLNVRLSNSQHLAADLVISATGVKPTSASSRTRALPLPARRAQSTRAHTQWRAGYLRRRRSAEALDVASG